MSCLKKNNKLDKRFVKPSVKYDENKKIEVN